VALLTFPLAPSLVLPLALALAACAVAMLPAQKLDSRSERGGRSDRAARRRTVPAAIGGAAVAVLVGLPVWAVALSAGLAALAAAVAARTQDRPKPLTDRETRDLAGFLDLIAACLDGGCTAEASLAAGAETGLLTGTAAAAVSQTRALLSLGTDVTTAWQPVAGYAPLASLGGAAARSALGGVRLADAARETAAEVRAAGRARAERRAARAGVAMTAPLMLCFLPAFVCLGLAPTIIGLISSLHLW